MFSESKNGYNKKEVEDYIENLKTKYETQIMEERLKTLESEKRTFDLKRTNNNLEQRIKNILSTMTTLYKVKEFEEKGLRKLYSLKIKQINLITDKTNQLVDELEKLNNKPEKVINEFKNLLLLCKKIQKEEKLIDTESPLSDNFKSLLEKMNKYQTGQSVKEVKIERKSLNIKPQQEKNTLIDDEKTIIKPVTDMTLGKDEDYDNLVDKFLSTKPEEDKLYKDVEFQASSFDLNEAINPKEGLDEIMKAFDFYNDNQN